MNTLKQFIQTTIREHYHLNENVGLLSDDDLYEIAKWGLENDYSESGCWDENYNFEDAIKCAIEDFKLFLSKPYPIELGNIPPTPVIYRLVRLKNTEDLRIDKLGYSWFSNPKQIDNPCFFDMLDYLRPWKTDEGQVYVIKGETNRNNIDMRKTLWERSTQWCENEIVVIDDSKIKILSVKPIQKHKSTN